MSLNLTGITADHRAIILLAVASASQIVYECAKGGGGSAHTLKGIGYFKDTMLDLGIQEDAAMEALAGKLPDLAEARIRGISNN